MGKQDVGPQETITKEEFDAIDEEPTFDGDPEFFTYTKETTDAYYRDVNVEGTPTRYTKSPKLELKNSRYYSNLTVPGGTNYTENEILTPGIVPSIKGHGRFSTGNGIGWFRSDDQVYRTTPVPNETIREEMEREEREKSQAPTVRRVLEVQSDLFQKGRERVDLINSEYDPTA